MDVLGVGLDFAGVDMAQGLDWKWLERLQDLHNRVLAMIRFS
jgi:hypothetical protein